MPFMWRSSATMGTSFVSVCSTLLTSLQTWAGLLQVVTQFCITKIQLIRDGNLAIISLTVFSTQSELPIGNLATISRAVFRRQPGFSMASKNLIHIRPILSGTL
jgi:hypothetical protein